MVPKGLRWAMFCAAAVVEPEGVGALDDRDLLAEIILLGEVVAAVAGVTHELSDAEVDEVLGVTAVPETRGGGTWDDPGRPGAHRRTARTRSVRPAG